SQEVKSCCSNGEKKKTEVSFVLFGNDESFRENHQLPNDYSLSTPQGKMIKFSTLEGKDANAYFIKSKSESDIFILVIHEWWGLNDNIKRESDELKKTLGDVNVLALDLYDGKIAVTRQDAAELMRSADAERIKQIFNGAVKFAGENAEFGTIGWCFGGGWSLQMSIWLEDKGKACVMYYGIIENSPETFAKLNAPVLGIFAKNDGWVNPEVYGNLEKNIKAAGKKITIKEYDADHAFANPSNQYFDDEAAQDAKNYVINFFKQYLLN
ncbi:MAG TPA: dienelactone hydrolase family protein, partial [Ignavibacteriaceae bacterium]|nr:dienelactone hydrolase family protein [Ignavibacteriaceae bacterium]